MNQAKPQLTESVKHPDELRARLAETLREAALLRRLLRVAESVHRPRKQEREGVRCAD